MTRSIRIYTREWSSLDAYVGELGEAPDNAYDDLYQHDEEFDSEPIQWAAQALRNLGLTAPSSSPTWTPGTWYQNPDGPSTYLSGRAFEHSGHLAGFQESEERAIFEEVTRPQQIEED